MSRTIRVGVAQCRTLPTTVETLASLERLAQEAAQKDVGLVLYPEAFLGGYPRTCNFGTAIGAREPSGREQFLSYYNAAIDLGDTIAGAGEAWASRSLPVPNGADRRGDGTREELERIAQETGVFLVVGLIEKSAGSMFCSAAFVSPEDGMLANKRRKVMPTGAERLVWTQGSTDTLKAVSTTIQGTKVKLGCAICWENYMPLLRYSLYSQDVDIYLAPTADGRDNWLGLMQTVAFEGRNFVLSCNQVTRRRELPDWVQLPSSESVHAVKKSSVSSKSGNRRLSRVTTQEGHEICWVDKPTAQENGTLHDEKINGRGSPTQNRKLSIVKTSGGHELCLPTFEEADTGDSVLDISEQPDDGDVSPLAKQASSSAFTASQISNGKPGGKDLGDDYVSRGGSCIISPLGEVISGPLWEREGLQIADLNLDDRIRGKLDFDVAGHYARSDSFQLTVKGLDLSQT